MSARASRRFRGADKKDGLSADKVIVVHGGEVVTVNDQNQIGRWDLRIEHGRIVELAEAVSMADVDEIIDAAGLVVLPGFVQAHIHLCQTLCRAHAESMELMVWLRERIWPMEGALQAEDLRASADLALCELLLSGTTCVLDMGTVRHTEVLFAEARRFGIRYTGGKTIMDRGHGYPAGLRETTDQALTESLRLCETWHQADEGRLRYAFAPRFVLAASDEAIKACAEEARKVGALLHSHVSENPEEVSLIREKFGMGNAEVLHHLGFSGPDVVLAHGVWLSMDERKILRDTHTHIVHCPSANLKLGSGIARVDELLKEGIHVALGSDGAACNNSLDAFMEMRLAGLLHKARGGPSAIPATQALRLATRCGAEALGLDDVGMIAVGKKADLVLLDLNKPHVLPDNGDLAARIVYSARPSDVHTVLVDGRILVKNGRLLVADTSSVMREANAAAERIRQRLG